MIRSKAAIATGIGAPLIVETDMVGAPDGGEAPVEIKAADLYQFVGDGRQGDRVNEGFGMMKRDEGIRTAATF